MRQCAVAPPPDIGVGGQRLRYRALRDRRARQRTDLTIGVRADRLLKNARRRADIRRYDTRPAYLDRLRVTPELVSAGLSATTDAAAELTETAARFDAYAARSTIERLVDEFKLRPAEDGNVTLRVVALHGAQLAVVLGSPLPDLAVAVDLIEDRDERTSAAGRALFRKAGRGTASAMTAGCST